MSKAIDIKRFAERVERLCNRLVEGMEHGEDRTAVMQLSEEAADLATGKAKTVGEMLFGVAEDIRR